MQIRLTHWSLLLALQLILTSGCAKHRSTMSDREPATEPTPQPRLASDADLRTQELREQVNALQGHIGPLPGRDEERHRELMQGVFAGLAQVLPLLDGPQPNGAFRQQMRIIESTQTQLATGSSDLASEPTIDTGLRAVYNALSSTQGRLFYDSKPIGQTLEGLRSRLSELDSVRGPIHRLVVAQSATLIGQALDQMTSALEGRMEAAPEQQPEEAPEASATGLGTAEDAADDDAPAVDDVAADDAEAADSAEPAPAKETQEESESADDSDNAQEMNK